MNNPGLFITGTDTEVGKTFIGAQLYRSLHAQNIKLTPRKPVESGCEIGKNGDLLPHDALSYYHACEQRVPLDVICPYSFTDAVAPDYAAKLAGINLTLDMLIKACQVSPDEFLLAEGAGGFYSPIAIGGLNADLAEALGLPVLLVADNRLGCINHTLLTAEAIQQRGLKLLAVILNHATSTELQSNRNNIDSIQTRLACPVYESPRGAAKESNWLNGLKKQLSLQSGLPV